MSKNEQYYDRLIEAYCDGLQAGVNTSLSMIRKSFNEVIDVLIMKIPELKETLTAQYESNRKKGNPDDVLN